MVRAKFLMYAGCMVHQVQVVVCSIGKKRAELSVESTHEKSAKVLWIFRTWKCQSEGWEEKGRYHTDRSSQYYFKGRRRLVCYKISNIIYEVLCNTLWQDVLMLDSTEVTEVTVTTDNNNEKVTCAYDNNSHDLIIWFTRMVKNIIVCNNDSC